MKNTNKFVKPIGYQCVEIGNQSSLIFVVGGGERGQIFWSFGEERSNGR